MAAALPVVVTCQPTGWDGLTRVVTTAWPSVWVTERVYEERYGYLDCCDYGGGWFGDFWFSYYD